MAANPGAQAPNNEREAEDHTDPPPAAALDAAAAAPIEGADDGEAVDEADPAELGEGDGEGDDPSDPAEDATATTPAPEAEAPTTAGDPPQLDLPNDELGTKWIPGSTDDTREASVPADLGSVAGDAAVSPVAPAAEPVAPTTPGGTDILGSNAEDDTEDDEANPTGGGAGGDAIPVMMEAEDANSALVREESPPPPRPAPRVPAASEEPSVPPTPPRVVVVEGLPDEGDGDGEWDTTPPPARAANEPPPRPAEAQADPPPIRGVGAMLSSPQGGGAQPSRQAPAAGRNPPPHEPMSTGNLLWLIAVLAVLLGAIFWLASNTPRPMAAADDDDGDEDTSAPVVEAAPEPPPLDQCLILQGWGGRVHQGRLLQACYADESAEPTAWCQVGTHAPAELGLRTRLGSAWFPVPGSCVEAAEMPAFTVRRD